MELNHAMSEIEVNYKPLVAANNEFAFKCYKSLRAGEENLFFSPFSISLCLAMSYIGAKNITAEQMASVLEFRDITNLNASFHWIMEGLNNPSRAKNYQLSTANALWLQQDYEVVPAYLEAVKKSYFGGIFAADFKNNVEGERQTINKWVEDRTNNRIKDLIKPQMINNLTRLILTNAIYFFSEWQNKFVRQMTQDDDFTLITGENVTVPLMYQKKYFAYTENAMFQGIEIPYRNADLSLVILLPKKVDGIIEMENSLKTKQLTGWLRKAPFEEVVLYLPKFKITSEFSLANTLKDMGINDAFDLERADFSGISPKSPDPRLNVYIGDVIHKAFIDLNEEGTEAAAATAVVMAAGAAMVERPSPVFRVDHPFLLMIRDTETDSILFMGCIMDPR